MSEGGALKALVGLRIGIGVASWATPRVAGKLFGLDAKANPQSPYLARLFGARDIALGVGALSSEGDARPARARTIVKTAGSTRSVASVANAKPPMTARPSGAVC